MNDILSISLAVAGFIFLVRYTSGPGDIFLDFRIRIGIYDLVNADGESYEVVEEKFFAKLFSCHWCLSTWLVPIAMLARFGCCEGTYGTANAIFTWLACIFVTCLLLEVVLLVRRLQ